MKKNRFLPISSLNLFRANSQFRIDSTKIFLNLACHLKHLIINLCANAIFSMSMSM